MPTRADLIRVALRGAGAVVVGGCASALEPAWNLSGTGSGSRAVARAQSVDKAFVFLGRMMDRYAQGSALRLMQSFVPTAALDLGDLAFTYDNAVAIVALLARADADATARARILGDSLVYAQQHDPAADGRIRTAYYVHPFVKSDGVPNFESGGAFDVGNTAWTGLALMQLNARTASPAYLQSALRLGNWIDVNARDTRGAGGYTGGLTASGQRIAWKSTEHNIDTYAFFTMLAQATGDALWQTRAGSALSFIDSMWHADGGFYWIGSLDDGVTANTDPIPEDVQAWSYLATQRAAYAGSIDWAYRRLAAHDGRFAGVSFSNADRSGVWFEGTGHMAAALALRAAPGDAGRLDGFLADLEIAQRSAPNADGFGIDAASKNGLKTGDGDAYFAALHVGATGWYCIARSGANPFTLG